jgi:hypothetical protein
MDIEPRIGVGPLKLLMSREQVAGVLGAPDSLYDPSDDEIFDASEKKFYRGQIVEIRKKSKVMALWDLIFEKNRLVCINMRGDSADYTIADMAVGGDRMALLAHVQRRDPDVYIRSENYAFMGTGLCISRAKNRKDINYVRLYDIAFKAKRLEFELYKKHAGPIIP